MKSLLILGGTQFIGRNLVEWLQTQNEFKITLFNRQKTGSNLFPHTHKIKGDRETDDIKQISHKSWDLVVDLSCYYPTALESAIANLVSKPEKYIFISTCSVYDNEHNKTILRNEDADILGCSDEQRIDREPGSYGNRKAECERILQASGLNHVTLRPSLVFGPHDHTDRFYYWLHQVQFKDTLLMPDKGERKFAITYVGDLVEAIVQSLSNSVSGVFNVITNTQTSIGEIVDRAVDLLGKKPARKNAPPDFLETHEVGQWMDMPLWLDGDFFTYDNHRWIRDMESTPTDYKTAIEKTISYYREKNWPIPQYGMPEEKRLALLKTL